MSCNSYAHINTQALAFISPCIIFRSSSSVWQLRSSLAGALTSKHSHIQSNGETGHTESGFVQCTDKLCSLQRSQMFSYSFFVGLFCAPAYKYLCLSFLFALWCTKNAELLFRVRHLTFFQERKPEEGRRNPAHSQVIQTSPKTHSCRYAHTHTHSTLFHM